MNRKALAVALLVAVAAVLLLTWRLWPYGEAESADALVLHGHVDIRQVSLAFAIRERLSAVFVEEGSRVEPGDLLAELNQESLLYGVKQARARVAAQREVLEQLREGTRKEELARIRAEVEAAEIEAQIAQKTARRIRNLVPSNLASREQADEAEARADAGQARLKAARARLALAEEGPRATEIAAAAANLEAMEAQLEQAEETLRKARLHAPSAGVIQSRLLNPGDMAGPEAPALVLALTDPVWVRAYVDGDDLGLVRPGMGAELMTDTFPDRRYHGWVGFISPTAEFTPKSVETEEVRSSLVYEVRVHVCDPEGDLRLGMPATVVLPVDPPRLDAVGCP